MKVVKEKRRLLRITALATGLSSTILFAAWGLMKLADKGHISRGLGFLIFVGVIISFFITIFANAHNKKDSL